MISFLKKIFAAPGSDSNAPAERGEAVEYEGFKIQPAPEPEGGQWRLAGYILRTANGDQQERKFVRADLFPSRDEATDFAVRKGRQIIDEQGERLFADGKEAGPA